jgi:uncharacterized protein YcbK (DUF882 family)
MESSGTLSLVGHHKLLSSRLKKLTAASILFAACAAIAWGTCPGPLTAAGETRTLSLYHVHTKESLAITYKKNGRYIPSALEKINYVLRDWRRNETIAIDPKTIDLMWELHADLDSQAPIHIISGYRSASTNAMLKKIGRNVAKQSMHIRGKAIDLYFPDVAVSKIQGSAIVRQVGGVGYYPRSGTSGFVHLDSGKVRYWPRPNETQLAQIMKDYKKTVGARMTNGYMTAQVDTGTSPAVKKTSGKVQTVASAPPVEDEEIEAVAPPTVKATAPAAAALASSYPVPKPRQKPIEVLMLAAAKMLVEPASAPPPKTNFAKRQQHPLAEMTIASLANEFEAELAVTNPLNKGSFAAQAQHEQTDLVTASTGPATSADDFFWWPTRWLLNTSSLVRRDRQNEPVDITLTSLNEDPKPPVQKANLVPWGLGDFIAMLKGIKGSSAEATPSGKADKLRVNRTGKGDIQARSRINRDRVGQADVLLDASVKSQSIQ